MGQCIRLSNPYCQIISETMSVTMNTSDDMRKRADWMVPSDDVILELLRDEVKLTPQAVEDYGGPSAGHVRDRIQQLRAYGLVTRVSRGLYELSPEGQAYLAEELDASELSPRSE